MTSDRFQNHQDEDEATETTDVDYLLSEEVQFTMLEKSFREVNLSFYVHYKNTYNGSLRK